MLIDTTFAVVLFCADCGRMHLEEVSAFTLRKNEKKIFCACEKLLGKMKALGRDRYLLVLGVAEGFDNNAVSFSRSIIGQDKIFPFPNFLRREEGGFVGSLSAVRKELETAAQELDYVNNLWAEIDAPEVMFEVINKVDDLAGEGSICCGSCGHNEIGLEVFDSFILLYCSHCGNMYEIRAKYQEDAREIRKVNFIELQPIREV